MRSILITIGDELLIGQIVNTNAAWLGQMLDALGIPLVRTVTVGDGPEDIRSALEQGLADAEVVILTGGLGPTHDDVTKHAVAATFGLGLETDPRVFARLEAYFTQRGLPFTETRQTMALVPSGFEPIDNPIGSAPGLLYVTEDGARRRIVALLPGVPYEMKAIVTQGLVPRLAAMRGPSAIRHRTLMTIGAGESLLAELIGDPHAVLPAGVSLAFLPNPALGVRLRLSCAAVLDEAPALLSAAETLLRDRVGRFVYGEEGDTLEGVVARLLVAQGRTVALAESCTGGLIAHRFTNVPGSSDYFLGGLVTYSNESKVRLLGVDPQVLAEEGAVSESVALQMAEGARAYFGATDGLAVTGIAGPAGGRSQKPVGTVWVAHADAHGQRARLHQLAGDRRLNKELASSAAMDLLRRQLLVLE